MMDDVARLADTAKNLMTIRRYDDARSKLGEALTASPHDAWLHVLMAQLEHEAGNTDAAHAAAGRALALDTNASSLHIAAIVERSRRSFDVSLELIDKAIEAQPELAGLHVGRALTLVGPFYGEEGRDFSPERDADTIRDAVASTERAAALDAEFPAVYYALALCEFARGDEPAAANSLDTALELRPEWVRAHLLMGHVRAHQGMAKLASRHLAAAGRLDPTDRTATELLRLLAKPTKTTVLGSIPFAVIIGVLLTPAGTWAAIAGFILALPVACFGLLIVRRLSRPKPPLHLTQEAQDILEIDARLGHDDR